MILTGDRVAPRTLLRGASTAAAGPQPEEAFARALRGKGLAADDAAAGDDADGQDGASGNGGSQASALACPIAAPAGLSQPSPAPGCEDGGDGPTAGIEATHASAAAVAALSMLAPTAVDVDSSVWEASVRDGSGVAVDLRAESAPPGPGGSAAWSVTVVSPALAAEILAQHAPDLTDRLRRRGIAARVRIDGASEDRGGAGEPAQGANPAGRKGSRHAKDEST